MLLIHIFLFSYFIILYLNIIIDLGPTRLKNRQNDRRNDRRPMRDDRPYGRSRERDFGGHYPRDRYENRGPRGYDRGYERSPPRYNDRGGPRDFREPRYDRYR